MTYREPVEEIRRLGAAGKIGAIVLAEQIVDTYLSDFGRPCDRPLALDALLRDLARLRRREPSLDGFIAQVESYIDGLHRDLARRAA